MNILKDTTIYQASKNIFARDKILVIKYVIIGIFLTALLIFTPRVLSGNKYPLFIFMGLIGLIGLYFILRWPILGLIFTLLGGIFLPYSWQGGFNASEIGIAFMLGMVLLNAFLIQRKINFVWSRTFVPLLFFTVLSVISFCIGQFHWYVFAENAPLVAQLGGLSINLLSIGAFFLAILIMTDMAKLELFTWTFIGLGLLYVLGRFLHLGIQDRFYDSGFVNGSLFWTWLVALLAGQVILNQKLKLSIRAILGIFLIMTLYVAVVQSYDWKSGWFPPLISIGVIFAVKYWRYVRYVSFLAVVPLYYVVMSSIGAEDYSWGTRLDAWKIVLQIVSISPVLGLGFANYYWYTPLFPIRGWFVRFNSHNQFVDLIAQTGVIGLLCFSWIFLEAGLLGLWLRNRVPDGFPVAYVYGALGGLVGTFVAGWLVDWVLPFTYNIGMSGFRASVIAWIFMGGLAAVEQIIRRNTQTTPNLI